MRTRLRHAFPTLITGLAWMANVTAAELTYKPINPGFGGNPFNSQYLLGTAENQNRFKDPNRRLDDDPAAQFVRALQGRLLSALANQIVDALFGDNPQDSGQVVFGNQTITFNRGLDSITIEILDTNTGSTTVIEVPTLASNAPPIQ
ncbi:MAG: curli assembly protein CsgF [Gammaproteobacteria bacterium]